MSTEEPAFGPRRSDAVKALLAASEALTAVLTKESEALAAHDSTAMRALLAEKNECLAAYEKVVATFTEMNARSAALDSTQASALKNARDRLHAASDQNRRRLEVARAGQRRLIELIVDSAKAIAAGPGLYARSGAVAKPAVRRTPRPPALSLNMAF